MVVCTWQYDFPRNKRTSVTTRFPIPFPTVARMMRELKQSAALDGIESFQAPLYKRKGPCKADTVLEE